MLLNVYQVVKALLDALDVSLIGPEALDLKILKKLNAINNIVR